MRLSFNGNLSEASLWFWFDCNWQWRLQFFCSITQFLNVMDMAAELQSHYFADTIDNAQYCFEYLDSVDTSDDLWEKKRLFCKKRHNRATVDSLFSRIDILRLSFWIELAYFNFLRVTQSSAILTINCQH